MNRIPSVMKTVVYLKTQGFYVNLLRHNSNKYINFYKQIITHITRYNLIVPTNKRKHESHPLPQLYRKHQPQNDSNHRIKRKQEV